jgi:2-dehydro-3-deoxygluconokinase
MPWETYRGQSEQEVSRDDHVPPDGPMSVLTVRDPTECRFDLVALGEVMLRLDPGASHIRTARTFRVWEGGGEYNVARSLRRCFGQRTAIVTALADNEIGRLIEDLIGTGGVDTSLVRWEPYDGIGRRVRNGLNFTERGFGARGAKGISDRGHTAIAALRAGDIAWDRVFSDLGARWLHTGGIFAALSESAPRVAEEAMAAAHRSGTLVSYDFNYRASLEQGIRDRGQAQMINRRLAEHIDVVIGNEDDFANSLGLPIGDAPADLPPAERFRRMVERVIKIFPNFTVVATTLRHVRSASSNDWGAIAWSGGQFAEATVRPGLDILDRVGGGDSFACGLIYGLLERKDLSSAVELGAALGALAMTTPGDTPVATHPEVEALADRAERWSGPHKGLVRAEPG